MATAKSLNESYQKFLETGNIEPLLISVGKEVASWFDSRNDNRFEDIAQETILKVWRSLPGYPGDDPANLYEHRGKFSSYVATIANNIYRNMNALHDNCEVAKLDPEILEDLAETGKFKNKRHDYQD